MMKGHLLNRKYEDMELSDLLLSGALCVENNKMYSFKKGFLKGLLSAILFSVPFLIDSFIVNVPQIASLTIGGALVVVWNYFKFKYIKK